MITVWHTAESTTLDTMRHAGHANVEGGDVRTLDNWTITRHKTTVELRNEKGGTQVYHFSGINLAILASILAEEITAEDFRLWYRRL